MIEFGTPKAAIGTHPIAAATPLRPPATILTVSQSPIHLPPPCDVELPHSRSGPPVIPRLPATPPPRHAALATCLRRRASLSPLPLLKPPVATEPRQLDTPKSRTPATAALNEKVNRSGGGLLRRDAIHPRAMNRFVIEFPIKYLDIRLLIYRLPKTDIEPLVDSTRS